MSKVEPQRHREHSGKVYRFSLLPMLLWLVVPAMTVQAQSLNQVSVRTNQLSTDTAVLSEVSRVQSREDVTFAGERVARTSCRFANIPQPLLPWGEGEQDFKVSLPVDVEEGEQDFKVSLPVDVEEGEQDFKVPLPVGEGFRVRAFNDEILPQSKVVAQSTSGTSCPAPVLSRLTRHRVRAGETLESIAQQYNLNPVTLRGLNPGLRGLAVPAGRELVIPPIDGIRVQVPAGSSWRDIAATYGVRADVLFEVNGCRQPSQQVFIPAETQASSGRQPADNYTGFAGYPLESAAAVGLSYGWHENSVTGQSTFHSGIDLLAEEGTPVLAVESGTVAFAGEQGVYGNLVVINHQGGRQTRYAHLSRVTVSRGEKVRRGAILGAVGSTGRPDIEKPHLHFEVRYNSPSGWVAQDPELHLPVRPTARR